MVLPEISYAYITASNVTDQSINNQYETRINN